MAVKIRLARRGRKKMAMYDVVVADARSPRDGRFIEKIGTYNPNTNPASIDINDEKAFDWVMDGAQPTDTVRAMLSYRGIMMKKHLQVGVNKGAITQEQADAKFEEWMKDKEAKIQGKVDTLTKAKDADAKARKAAETKVKEARAEALQKKQADAAAVEAAAKAEAEPAVEEAPETEEVAAEAAPEAAVEEKATEEAPAKETPAEEPAAEAKKEEAPAADATEEAKKAE